MEGLARLLLYELLLDGLSDSGLCALFGRTNQIASPRSSTGLCPGLVWDVGIQADVVIWHVRARYFVSDPHHPSTREGCGKHLLAHSMGIAGEHIRSRISLPADVQFLI